MFRNPVFAVRGRVKYPLRRSAGLGSAPIGADLHSRPRILLATVLTYLRVPQIGDAFREQLNGHTHQIALLGRAGGARAKGKRTPAIVELNGDAMSLLARLRSGRDRSEFPHFRVKRTWQLAIGDIL